MKAKITAELVAGTLLAGAGTARAAFVPEAGSPYPVGDQHYNIYTGDFNGDGWADVATINGTSSDVSVYLRNPGGGFTQAPGSPFAGGPGNGSAAVADFDGNGLTDIITTNFVESTVSVLLAQPGGGFALQNGTRTSLSGGPQAAAPGDFNGDGRPDYVLSLYNSNVIAVMINTGTGFTEQSAQAGNGQPSTPTVADFDGDGRLDYAAINQQGQSVTVVRQTGPGAFTPEATITLFTPLGGIASGDFNGDGRPDLAITRNVNPGTVTILLRNASNDGFAQAPYGPVAVSATPLTITTADFNVDGRPDLALTAASGAVNVLENTGNGFAVSVIPMSATAQSGIATADFDHDGRPDIVASEYASNTFSTLLNPAAAVAPPPPPPPPPTPLPPPTPTPVAGVNVIGSTRSGTVKVKKPGSKTYVTLAPGTPIPVGSSIDTRKGKITITAAQGSGATASAWFYDGLFKLTQTKGSKPLTTLTLTETLSCPKRGAASTAAKKKDKKPPSRKLWGDGKGSFQTKGEFSAATVRGTKWLVQDTCDATLTRVARGVVSVRDFVKDKTVTVRAGKSYTARRKR